MPTTANTVHVSGLSPTVTKESVTDFFTRVGDVTNVIIQEVDGGAVTAIVTLRSADDADEAVLMSGSEFTDGTPITIVKQSIEKAEGEEVSGAQPSAVQTNGAGGAPAGEDGGAPADRDAHKIVVLRLSTDTTEIQLREFFGPCGAINDVFVTENRSRRHAYIGFATAEGVEAALTKNGEMLNGSVITVERKRRVSHDHRVMISNIPADCTEEAMRGFFTAADCSLSDLHVDCAKGISYVNFSTADDAERAVAKNGEALGGSTLKIELKPRVCEHCGKAGHPPSRCTERRAPRVTASRGMRPMGQGTSSSRARDIVCHSCGKVGHFARNCSSGAPIGRGLMRGDRGGMRGDRGGMRRYRDDDRDFDRDRRRYRDDRDDRDGRDYRRSYRDRSRSFSRSRSYDRERRNRRRRSSSTPPRRRRDRSRSPRSPRSPISPRTRSPHDRRVKD